MCVYTANCLALTDVYLVTVHNSSHDNTADEKKLVKGNNNTSPCNPGSG